MPPRIELIVGLGNPGSKYAETRHNAGFWFLDRAARAQGKTFAAEEKFHGHVSRITLTTGDECWLLKPDTFVNRSGQALVNIAQYYKIPPENILVAYDELDLPAGVIKLKSDGGHGGHNGVRNIITLLGANNFYRLRIGIGHPGKGNDVTAYVLNRPTREEQALIEVSLDQGLAALPLLLAGEIEKAMQFLHTRPGNELK